MLCDRQKSPITKTFDINARDDYIRELRTKKCGQSINY